jgi:hypothetical protein
MQITAISKNVTETLCIYFMNGMMILNKESQKKNWHLSLLTDELC